MIKTMFTCAAGKQRFLSGEEFWGWDEETLEENYCIIEVDESGYEVEDLGCYHIKDLSKVTFIKNI